MGNSRRTLLLWTNPDVRLPWSRSFIRHSIYIESRNIPYHSIDGGRGGRPGRGWTVGRLLVVYQRPHYVCRFREDSRNRWRETFEKLTIERRRRSLSVRFPGWRKVWQPKVRFSINSDLRVNLFLRNPSTIVKVLTHSWSLSIRSSTLWLSLSSEKIYFHCTFIDFPESRTLITSENIVLSELYI